MSLLGDYGLCDPRLISDGNNDGCVNVQDLMLLLELFGTDYFCNLHGTREVGSDTCVCSDFLDSNGVSIGRTWGGERCESPPGGALWGVGSNMYGQLGIGTVGGGGGYGQPACQDHSGCDLQPNLVKAGPCDSNGQCAPGCNFGCAQGSWGSRDGSGINCNVPCTLESPQATQFDNNDLVELYASGQTVIVKRRDGKFFAAGEANTQGTNRGWDGARFQPRFNTVFEEITALDQWDITSLKGGTNYFLALTTTGGVVGWGSIPNTPWPGLVREPNEIDFVGPGTEYGPVIYIGARQGLTAYIVESGSVVFAGNGKIGDGTNSANPSTLLASVGNDNVQIELGGSHALILKEDGSVTCWGDSQRGQCGTPGHNIYDTPIVYPGLPRIKQVEASRQTSYFLSVDGEIWASGLNNNGQVGNGEGSATYSEQHGYNGVFAAEKIDGYPTDPNQFLVDVQADADHVIVVQPNGMVYGSGNNFESCLTADGYTVNRGACCAQQDVNILTAQQLTGLGTNIFAAGASGNQNGGYTVLLKRGN
jgi:alpha-tubulin suppressor-like RCC1 family protein